MSLYDQDEDLVKEEIAELFEEETQLPNSCSGIVQLGEVDDVVHGVGLRGAEKLCGAKKPGLDLYDKVGSKVRAGLAVTLGLDHEIEEPIVDPKES